MAGAEKSRRAVLAGGVAAAGAAAVALRNPGSPSGPAVARAPVGADHAPWTTWSTGGTPTSSDDPTAGSASEPAAAPTSTVAAGPASSAGPPGDPYNMLRRATFGITAHELAEFERLGPAGWVDHQLAWSGIDDQATESAVATIPILSVSAAQIRERYSKSQGSARLQLQLAATVRAVASRRQLYERMVGFWSDHFSIDLRGSGEYAFKPVDDRTVIRPHALGRFVDLLAASVTSPAMLNYLDNHRSRKGKVNENYARELLELHTVGIHGGYGEGDIANLAVLLTGLTYHGSNAGDSAFAFTFNERQHDPEPVQIMEWSSEGPTDLSSVMEFVAYLAGHPATARHLASKLATKFVGDEPPGDLVERAARTYLTHGTAIGPMVREILLSDELARAEPRTRRGFEFVVGTLRASGAAIDIPTFDGSEDPDSNGLVDLEIDEMSGMDDMMGGGESGSPGSKADRALRSLLARVGHAPFEWGPPDGVPVTSAYWTTPGSLLARWNAAYDILANRLSGVRVAYADHASAGALADEYGLRVLGRALTESERRSVTEPVGGADTPPPSRSGALATFRATVAGTVCALPGVQLT